VSAVSFVAYRGLLAEPVLRRLAVADACVRLPQGMVSITVLLVDAALSATEVAVTGYVRHHHALWASGPLLAEVSTDASWAASCSVPAAGPCPR